MSFDTDKYEIDILNVKDADSILIRCYNGETPYTVLIDAGNISDCDNIKNHLKNKYQNTIIDLAICTHPDKDHIGGFFGLLDADEITINEFWLIDPAEYLDETDIKHYQNKSNAMTAVRKIFNKPNDSSQNLITKLLAKEIPTYSVIAGRVHKDIPIKVMAPTKGYYAEKVKEMVADYGVKTYEESDTTIYDENALPAEDDVKSVIDLDDDPSPFNAGSIVLLFEPSADKKYLFAGDSNCASLSVMLESYEKELQNITMLKVPHHGSKHNLTTEIIECLSPKISIISAKGTKKHPNSGIVHWLSKSGNVYSTHKHSGGLHYHIGLSSRQGSTNATPLKKKS